MIQCKLCPKYCRIDMGQSGDCKIRINPDDSELTTVTYGYPCAIHIDPIEKKPLFHFLPGSEIMSFGTAGCNLHCLNCQNWEISQGTPSSSEAIYVSPEKIVEETLIRKLSSIAYTYAEPLVSYEYTLDTSIKARESGIKNVLVTAGYINDEPLKKLLPWIDAANIDLKSISDSFYRKITTATLRPVLNTLVRAKETNVFLEVTNLLIPTLNDSEKEIDELSRWIKENLGADTPLHFSRFYPRHRMQNLPPTPAQTLLTAREIAKKNGLYYVYIGNLLTKESENTYCPGCNKLLIERRGFSIVRFDLKDKYCPHCKKKITGVWI